MKKYFQLLIALLFSLKVDAQVVFCPPGAEWNYTFHTFASNSYNDLHNETIRYGKDSVAGNENIKILYHKRFFTKHNRMITSQSLIKQMGDTIFVKSHCTANRWQILYNFAATAGQSWTIAVYPMGSLNLTLVKTYTINVQTVSTININNFNLKRLYVLYASNGVSEQAIITERLGCETFLFNYQNNIDSDGDRLEENLCYKDSTFGVKQYTEKPCDYTYYVEIRENNYDELGIKIYPNPSSDFLMINNENELISGPVIVSIENLYGQEIKQVLVNNLTASTRIDMHGICEGVYILKLTKGNSVIYNGKLVKSG